jgi:hypothetical protein
MISFPENSSNWLFSAFDNYNNTETKTSKLLQLPGKKGGSSYTLRGLNEDQHYVADEILFKLNQWREIFQTPFDTRHNFTF